MCAWPTLQRVIDLKYEYRSKHLVFPEVLYISEEDLGVVFEEFKQYFESEVEAHRTMILVKDAKKLLGVPYVVRAGPLSYGLAEASS